MDNKTRAEQAFVELLSGKFIGVDLVRGADRETVVGPMRISVSAKIDPLPGNRMFYADAELLLVTPDTQSDAERRFFAGEVEAFLRQNSGCVLFFDALDVSLCGYVVESASDASEEQSNGDLFAVRAGFVLGDIRK